MWVARVVDSISDHVSALLHTVKTFLLLLGLSCLSWAGFGFFRGESHWQLRVIHAFIRCFTNLTTSQSFSTDKSSFYSSYCISPSIHALVLHITELLLFFPTPQIHLFFLSAPLTFFCINTFFQIHAIISIPLRIPKLRTLPIYIQAIRNRRKKDSKSGSGETSFMSLLQPKSSLFSTARGCLPFSRLPLKSSSVHSYFLYFKR